MIIEHKFVQNIPASLEAGILYVTLEYSTAVHLCACGCGQEVVTPIAPGDKGWQLIYDGKTISLTPSIGNWNFNCRSHYWIKKGKLFFDYSHLKKTDLSNSVIDSSLKLEVNKPASLVQKIKYYLVLLF